jgi:hypothetical protein
MLVSRRIKFTTALAGPVFVGFALIAGLTTISHQAAQAEDSSLANMEAKAANCPALPNVLWWKTTHVKIVKYVDRKYRGNWTPYIQKWINYKKKMQGILESDGTALVKSRDIRLRGDELAAHILEIEQRLIVTRCLQSKFSGQLASNGTGGSSGTDNIDPNIRQASLAPRPATPMQDQFTSINEARLDVEVTARCDGDTPTFQVTNLGALWPRLAAISIHRTDGNALVSKRRMKLANSQQATFKVRKRGKALRGEIGIFVQPSWAKRPFRYDTKIRCR